jgi:hypothetical protein
MPRKGTEQCSGPAKQCRLAVGRAGRAVVAGLPPRAGPARLSARCHGLQRSSKLGKVRAVPCMFALADKLMRVVKLAPQLIGWRTGASLSAARET